MKKLCVVLACLCLVTAFVVAEENVAAVASDFDVQGIALTQEEAAAVEGGLGRAEISREEGARKNWREDAAYRDDTMTKADRKKAVKEGIDKIIDAVEYGLNPFNWFRTGNEAVNG